MCVCVCVCVCVYGSTALAVDRHHPKGSFLQWSMCMRKKEIEREGQTKGAKARSVLKFLLYS